MFTLQFESIAAAKRTMAADVLLGFCIYFRLKLKIDFIYFYLRKRSILFLYRGRIFVFSLQKLYETIEHFFCLQFWLWIDAEFSFRVTKQKQNFFIYLIFQMLRRVHFTKIKLLVKKIKVLLTYKTFLNMFWNVKTKKKGWLFDSFL